VSSVRHNLPYILVLPLRGSPQIDVTMPARTLTRQAAPGNPARRPKRASRLAVCEPRSGPVAGARSPTARHTRPTGRPCPRYCETTPQSPATTASAPNAPGTAYRPWSVGACQRPTAPLRPAPRRSGNQPAACNRVTPPCSPTAARTRNGAASGDHRPAPVYHTPSTPASSRGVAAR